MHRATETKIKYLQSRYTISLRIFIQIVSDRHIISVMVSVPPTIDHKMEDS